MAVWAWAGWLLFLVGFIVVFLWSQRKRQYVDHLLNELQDVLDQSVMAGSVSESKFSGSLRKIQKKLNQLFQANYHHEHAQRNRVQHLQSLVDGVQEALIIHRDTMLYANGQASAMRGLRQGDLLGHAFLDVIHPADRARARSAIKLATNTRRQPLNKPYELRLMTRSGETLWVEASWHPITFEGKAAWLFTAINMSKHHIHQQSLTEANRRAHTTLGSISDAVITTDVHGVIDYVNPVAEAMIGINDSELCGQAFGDVIKLIDDEEHKTIANPVDQALKLKQKITLGRPKTLHLDGHDLPVEVSVSPITEHPKREQSSIVGAIVLLRDASDLVGVAKKMSYQATHDPLTGLLNRPEFECRVASALEQARTDKQQHILCYLDLDRFKAVNDSCGHMAGDNMLREVATLIKAQVRDSDSVARLGGDEFGMVLSGCPLSKAQQIGEDICKAMHEYRFVWRDQVFSFGVSIGLVELSSDSGNVDDAINAADSACYVAKERGRGGVHVYSTNDESHARNRGEIVWLKRLQLALNEDQFELYTQAIVASAKNDIVPGPAYEVLVRMPAEHGRRVLPKKFMPAAKRYQLMPKLDRWVVRATLAAISQDTLSLRGPQGVAINLSGQTMADPTFLEFLVECLDTYGVAPNRLYFEVSENDVLENLNQAHRFIEVLHGLGCHFGLDDFGSGVGAIAHLKNLAMDYIKLDGPVVSHFDEPINQAIVSAVVDLSRTLDIKVMAEQIESREVLSFLRELGVDYFQGYAIAYPVPLYQPLDVGPKVLAAS